MGKLLRSRAGRAVMRFAVWVGVCAAALGSLALLSLAFPEETSNAFGTVGIIVICALIIAAMVAFVVATPGWILWIGCVPLPFKIIAIMVAGAVIESLVANSLIPQWTDKVFPTIAGNPAFDVCGIAAIAGVVAVAVVLNRALDRAIVARQASCAIDAEAFACSQS